MSEKEKDPSATTHQFQAFANRQPAEPVQTPRGNTGLILGVTAVAAVIVLAVIGYLMVG
ncbi:hypothetical protein [Actinomadura craniellae]|uniref:hypothetical protein n=1 Tax=Actinomadura craniellae TaxID=2231787 RepID=UPI0018F13C56|nr:hypothetical protein [Actinomadura craniellae]